MMNSNTSGLGSESAPKEAVFNFYQPPDSQATNTSSRSIHGITHEHQSLEPYRTVPVSYSYPGPPAQRTRMDMHHDQFSQIHRESSQKRERSYTLPSASFSLPSIPSDKPPPSLRLPNPSFPSLDSAQSSSSSRPPVNYRGLSLSLSDSEDDVGYSSPQRDFITIVPQPVESSTNFSTGSEFERPYIQGSGISAPNFTSEVASPISIETIPSYVEAREWGRRKGPEKMHRCEICGKEFPRPSAVNTHMNVHNNARPFPCGFPNCPKTFSVRSNARRHHRTHSEKALPPTSPLPSHSGFQFAELIVPEPRPLPLPPSPNQSSFRVRWVANNTTTRPRLAPSTKRSGKKSNASGMTDNSDDEQPPILLYDPFSGTQGSHDVREI